MRRVIYNYYPDYLLTAGPQGLAFSDESVVVANIRANSYAPPGVTHKSDQYGFTFINSTLSAIDTFLVLEDTSSYYTYLLGQQLIVDDTLYVLMDCVRRKDSSSAFILERPANFFFCKIDRNYNFHDPKYLFAKDTVGFHYTRGVNLKWNSTLRQFEFFTATTDTAFQQAGVSLSRFTRDGELKYYKPWSYDVLTQNFPIITDFKRLGQGKYLVSQNIKNDIYFIADTASHSIDTSYFKPEIRGLWKIEERKDSYLLFGTADGHKWATFQEGKLQYVLLELDKQTLAEKSRRVYKLKDTLDYEIEALYWRNSFDEVQGGDYIFTATEAYYDVVSNIISVYSIYRIDSLMNVVWSYHIADTTYGELFGAGSLDAIPGNPDEFLYTNAAYSPNGSLPYSTWVRKIAADGSNLGIGLKEERAKAAFGLYPNPAREQFVILLPFLPSAKVVVEICSMTGQVIEQRIFERRDNLLKLSVDLPTGSYLVKVSSDDYSTTKKLMVE